MNTFLKVFLTQRLQFCVYFILDVHTCAAGGVAILGTPTIIGLVAGGAAVGAISGPIDGGFEITQMLAKKDDEKQEEQKLDFEGSKKIINSNLENSYSSTSLYNSNTSIM
ncbi:hypothetical protein [Spiroplasma endosymbiont of Aleiodes alternator]|uniref:hypothetical protein n=1 Tax=Spiroplasma endosymbiont of Aleiodes alternator TaxID=3139329 RepID=UPI003CCB7361